MKHQARLAEFVEILELPRDDPDVALTSDSVADLWRLTDQLLGSGLSENEAEELSRLIEFSEGEIWNVKLDEELEPEEAQRIWDLQNKLQKDLDERMMLLEAIVFELADDGAHDEVEEFTKARSAATYERVASSDHPGPVSDQEIEEIKDGLGAKKGSAIGVD